MRKFILFLGPAIAAVLTAKALHIILIQPEPWGDAGSLLFTAFRIWLLFWVVAFLLPQPAQS